jgi:hypothetical protein
MLFKPMQGLYILRFAQCYSYSISALVPAKTLGNLAAAVEKAHYAPPTTTTIVLSEYTKIVPAAIVYA